MVAQPTKHDRSIVDPRQVVSGAEKRGEAANRIDAVASPRIACLAPLGQKIARCRSPHTGPSREEENYEPYFKIVMRPIQRRPPPPL